GADTVRDAVYSPVDRSRIALVGLTQGYEFVFCGTRCRLRGALQTECRRLLCDRFDRGGAAELDECVGRWIGQFFSKSLSTVEHASRLQRGVARSCRCFDSAAASTSVPSDDRRTGLGTASLSARAGRTPSDEADRVSFAQVRGGYLYWTGCVVGLS